MKIEELENNINNFILGLRDDEISQSSLKVYESNINNFIKYLKSNDINIVDKNTYIDYREYMQTKYKITTINKYVVILNKYFSFLDHEELKIKQLKYQRKHYIENVPDVTDYKRILRTAKKYDTVAYYIILIASYTGMRISAIRNITIDALKESKHNDDYIKILSKNKYNEIPFPAWLRRELLKYVKDKKIKGNYLFPSPYKENSPLTRKTMWLKIQKVTGKARVSLSKGHPHAFRHLLGKEITKYMNNDSLVVADILGHESTRTTEIYQQKSKKEISKELNNFRFK